MKKFYLDNAATTKPYPQVVDAMLPYLTNEFGNPGSKYLLGRNAKDAIETARKQVAKLINAEPEQIIFTSSGSEANNTVLKVKALTDKAFHTTVCSTVEHPSIYKYVSANASRNIDTLVQVTSQGIVTEEALISAINEVKTNFVKAPFVSIMYVNNELGSVNDVQMIARVCKEHGCLFHTDCTQAVTCKPIDVKEIGCDFATISAHKIHGPKGVGALYVRDKSLLGLYLYDNDKKSYLIDGGSNQEFGMRAGTENVPGIVGFGKAAMMYKNSFNERIELVKEHSMLFLKVLHDELGDGFRLNCPETNDHLKILSLTFFGVDSETLLLALDQEGVFVSAGSACSNHESEPSHVLKAIGMSREDTFNTIRVSFSGDESVFDISEAASIIADKVKLLKRISDKVKKIMKEKES